MDQRVSDVVAPQRLSTQLVGVFAAIALLLASVGLYGLLAYTTAQRRKEIALRMALGAERRSVVGMVIGQGARLVAMGLVVGLIASLALTRLVASLLYQTNPYDLTGVCHHPGGARPGRADGLCASCVARRAGRADHSAPRRLGSGTETSLAFGFFEEV